MGVMTGTYDIVVAGGVESMSRAPLVTAKPEYGDGTTYDTQLGWRFPNPRLEEKFPTGALATLVVHSESWAALSPGDAELVDYVVPRQLR